MAKESERVHLMKENFIELHDQGYCISEIAEMYTISVPTVYRSLQEIADKSGRTRESLLQVVRTTRSERTWQREARKVNLDVEMMEKDLESASTSLTGVIERIESILKEEQYEIN